MSGIQSKPERDDGLGVAVKLSRVFGAKVRMEILCSLAGSPSDVTALATALELDGDSVSPHLGPLRKAGYVSMQPDGRWHIYSLGPRAAVRRLPGKVEVRLERPSGVAMTLVIPDHMVPEALLRGLDRQPKVVVAAAKRKRRPASKPPNRPGDGPSDI